MFAKMENIGSIGFDPMTSLHLHGSYFNIVTRAWFILKDYCICIIVVVCIMDYDLAWMPTKVDTTTSVYLSV